MLYLMYDIVDPYTHPDMIAYMEGCLIFRINLLVVNVLCQICTWQHVVIHLVLLDVVIHLMQTYMLSPTSLLIKTTSSSVEMIAVAYLSITFAYRVVMLSCSIFWFYQNNLPSWKSYTFEMEDHKVKRMNYDPRDGSWNTTG